MITPQALAAALCRFPGLVSPDQTAGILALIPQTSALHHAAWSASDIKDGAHELMRAAAASGAKLSHGHALKIASAVYGFSSWNAALGTLGRREDIAIPGTLSPMANRYKRLSSCSPACLHGNFSGLAAATLNPGAENACLPEAMAEFDGQVLAEREAHRMMLVLSQHSSDLERLKARYPLEHVVFMDQPFYPSIWQAMRLGFGHILIDRPNLGAPVTIETFRMITHAHATRHNMIIATDAPEGLPEIDDALDEPERAYRAFLSA